VLAYPDFVEETAVAERLFEAALARARDQRARELVGPLNPDIHHDVGILVRGHGQPNAILMGYQPPYYGAFFDAWGFRELAAFEAWRLTRDTFRSDGRLRQAVHRVERCRGFQLRTVDLGAFDRELALFFRLYCGAFVDHWGFTAPSWEEFHFLAGDLRYLLRGSLALVAEWHGEPVGFALGVPDVYAILPRSARGRLTPGLLAAVLARWRRVREVRVMIAGVLPPFRRHGIHLPLFYRMAEGVFALGYDGGEVSWVMSGNRPMVRALSLLGASHAKTYRVYSKDLHQ
jgi:hypothetical protein